MKRSLLCALLLLLAGCAHGESGSVAASGDELLPSGTAVDWVTYGDVAARVTVERAVEVPATDEEVKAGEGIIGRQVVITIDDVLWRQGARTLKVPSELTLDAGGWTFKGTERRKLAFEGTVDLVPGHDYLLVLAYTPLDDAAAGTPRWIPIGSGAMLPFDDGVVGRGAEKAPATSLASTLADKRSSDVVALLGVTKPQKAAEPYLDEPAIARIRAVQRG